MWEGAILKNIFTYAYVEFNIGFEVPKFACRTLQPHIWRVWLGRNISMENGSECFAGWHSGCMQPIVKKLQQAELNGFTAPYAWNVWVAVLTDACQPFWLHISYLGLLIFRCRINYILMFCASKWSMTGIAWLPDTLEMYAVQIWTECHRSSPCQMA